MCLAPMDMLISKKDLTDQAEFVAIFDAADFWKRVVTSGMAASFLAYLGAPLLGLGFFLAIVANEMAGRWLRHRLPADAPITFAYAFWVHARVAMTCVLFAAMSISLMAQGTILGLLIGVYYLTSSMMQTISANVMFSGLRWITFGINALGLWACVFVFATRNFTPQQPGDWMILSVYTLVLIIVGQINMARGAKTRSLFQHASEVAQERAEQLAFLAHHDPLTGLLNRRTFDEVGMDTVQSGQNCTVLFMDLDGFKQLNDTHGHAAGDAVLAEVARRIKTYAGDALVARLGGDEFAVILTDGRDAKELSQRLQRSIAQPFLFEGHALSVGISIGYAVQNSAATSFETLCKQADAAMYTQKRQRRRESQIAV